MIRYVIRFLVFVGLPILWLIQGGCSSSSADNQAEKPALEIWSEEKANQWYEQQGWLVGANFNPASAINQLEMWQKETFDPERIDLELGWAEDLGMNTMRVYLHDLVYKNDPEGLLDRIDQFLEITESHGIRPMFVIFDAVWDPFPKAGPQRAPKPHVHNSGWVQSPSIEVLQDSSEYPRLEQYVKGVIGHFADDDRILAWDIWNEPDNPNVSAYGDVELKNKVDYVLPLLEKAFEWAREANPSQPLTSGVWNGNWASHESLKPIEKLQIEQSDIISFHCYDDPATFEKKIKELSRYNRPLFCTEYMARPNGSTFEGFLPIAKTSNIAMYNWGFVSGKSQTIYPWDSWRKEYTAEPELWFHDIFRTDGTPYKESEVEFIKDILTER